MERQLIDGAWERPRLFDSVVGGRSALATCGSEQRRPVWTNHSWGGGLEVDPRSSFERKSVSW